MITLFSPSKLNLFFRVLRRREDGYHEIASLYQTISLGDVLHLKQDVKDILTCDDPAIPLDASNLIWKAADVFRRRTGWTRPVNFHLEKRVPMQSGLGGGSGNAATALWALNLLAGKPASTADLIAWAGEFSSDASFFFSQGSAYCTSRGEQVREVPRLTKRSLWLAKPKEGLGTPLVYKYCKAHALPDRDPESALQGWLAGNPHYFNDLELSAFTLMPSLKELKQRLLNLGFEAATMTGSGTAFYCIGDIQKPSLEGIQFYNIHFIGRDAEHWYNHES